MALQAKEILTNINHATQQNKIFSQIQKEYILVNTITNNKELLNTVTAIKNDPILKNYNIRINISFNSISVISFDNNFKVAFDTFNNKYTKHNPVGFPEIDENGQNFIYVYGELISIINNVIGFPSRIYMYTNYNNDFRFELHDHDNKTKEIWSYNDIDIDLLNEIDFHKKDFNRLKKIWENSILNKFPHNYTKYSI